MSTTGEHDICQDCGCTIPKVQKESLFGLVTSRLVRCQFCGYQDAWRDHRTCRKPFKEPFPRIKLDGTLPEEMQRQWMEAIESP